MRPRIAASVAVSAAVSAALWGISRDAAADPLPPGAIGLVSGAVAGTGADAKRVGFGYYPFGAQASWQPTSSERSWGWSLRWSTLFGRSYGGSAAKIDSSLQTVQMDLSLGLRFRPWRTITRYLTVRGGGELLRANEPIPPKDQRAFLGGVASVGLDQYLGPFLLSVDVSYGLIGSGPEQLSLLVGFAVVGP